MSDDHSENWIHKILVKFSNSREFTVSFILHVIMVAVFGTAVLFETTQDPPDFQSQGGSFFVPQEAESAPPPQDTLAPATQEVSFDIAAQLPAATGLSLPATTASAPASLQFDASQFFLPKQSASSSAQQQGSPSTLPPSSPSLPQESISPQVASSIKNFTSEWSKSPPSVGTRQREFLFTAFLGKYAGGNWNSTVEVGVKDKIVKGSLPNLLWIINKWSKDKITTNEKNIRVINLSSSELFSVKPPFIFLTGTRDFVLTESEIKNLRKYVRMGGCIWGDSSVPGRNSRFDIAFRREMRRIIDDVDKNFVPLPPNHPIFTSGYFPEIKKTPPGINFHEEPPYALHIYGEIAILYTANDYGDMWQIGIDENGSIDLKKNSKNQLAAVNEQLWKNRFLYVGNIAPSQQKPGSPPSSQNLVDAYKFGTNIIVHLLTRWDRITANAPSL